MRAIFGVLLLTSAVGAGAAQLRQLELSDVEDGTRAALDLSAESSFKYFTLTDPDRLVIDIAGARRKPSLDLHVLSKGLVKDIRTGLQGDALRIVFDATGPVAANLIGREVSADGSQEIIFDLHPAPAKATHHPLAAVAPPSAGVGSGSTGVTGSEAGSIPVASLPPPPAELDVPAGAVAAGPEGLTIPPVRDRPTEKGQKARVQVRGFLVTGVSDHHRLGITPQRVQKLADDDFAKLGGPDSTPEVSLEQLQDVADDITRLYKNAGFIVARAIIPSQSLADDKIVQIQVLEGKLGKIIVKGAKRYYPWVVAAPAQNLVGKPVLKESVDTALLYMRDIPGDAIAATFQPGSKTGETDLVVVSNEAPRPFVISAGGNDYGTDLTGRYRAQLGLTWNGLLGLGDQFVAKGEYAFDPSNNIFGSLNYRIPLVIVPGLAASFGVNHDELTISGGSFAALNIKGPTTTYYGGPDWKFFNTVDMTMQGSVLFSYEKSRLSSDGIQLADEQFLVGLAKFELNHTDRRFHGVDLIDAGVRRSIHDSSNPDDEVSPVHARQFTAETLSYTRLQSITASQRLYAKISGQYTNEALIPLEQFVIGGPDSVRAYPIADALRDRGFYGSLEYHIDAPGFGNVTSPFYGRPWREVLELETFVDYARGYSAGADRSDVSTPSTLSGAGGGFIFRVPRFYQLQFHLDVSAPLGDQKASNGADVHVYGQIGVAF